MLSEFRCTSCGAPLEQPEEAAGSVITCEFCQVSFVWKGPESSPDNQPGRTASPGSAGGGRVHKLIPLGAMLAGKVFVLKGDTSFGRSEDCAIHVEHGSLAPRHALLSLRGDAVVLSDLEAGRGIGVNRRGIGGPTTLSPGDIVTIGDFDFRYERGG